MTEMALALPIFLLLILTVIDVSRYIYFRGTLESDAREADRLLTLAANRTTDCPSQNYVLDRDIAFVNVVDPTSVWGNGSTPGTTPSSGQGEVYLYPAVAQSSTDCTASGSNQRPAGEVSATITYRFASVDPLLTLLGPLTITATSTQPTEY